MLKILILVFALFTSSSTTYALEFGSKGSDPGQFGNTIYLAFGKGDTIYVSDPDNYRIQVFTPEGKFLRLLLPSPEQGFRFNRIGELAVGPDGSLWIADWKAQPLAAEKDSSTQQSPIYFLTPCVHHLDPTGRYLGTVLIDSLTTLKGRDLVPAVEKGGKMVFIVRSVDFDRPLHLATDQEGNLFVLDEKRNRIYGYDSSGKLRLCFGKFGQLDHAKAIDCDEQGGIYVADTGNSRIVKFDPSGRLLFSTGQRGLGDRQFVFPYLLRVTRDAKLLVADRSRFKRSFKSYLPQRGEDSLGTEPLGKRKTKEYLLWLRRIQVLSLNGKFKRKFLIRLSDREKGYRLIGISRKGALFLFDPETHRIRTETISSTSFSKKFLQKSYRLRVEKGVRDFNIDSGQEEIIGDLGYNYLTNLQLLTLSQSLLLQYDFTERLKAWTEGTVFFLHAYRSVRYPQEKPPPGGWRYDRLLFDDFIDGEVKWGLKVLLDPNPYEYRELRLFLSVGGRIYHFSYDMLSRRNQMHGVWHLWQRRFGTGIDWDIRRDFNIYFNIFVKSPGERMNYRYQHWNEEGDLRSQGWFKGDTITAYGGINIVF